MKKKLTFSLYFLFLIVYPFQNLLAQAHVLKYISDNEFHAVYDRLLDYYTHDINIRINQ